jgi:DNA-binding CsgD family transcriptional regulator
MAATDWELFTESISQAALGWRDADAARRWAAVLRDATTPDEFRAFLEARREWDVADRLGQVRAPTLILHDRSNALASEERSRELASSIPGASLFICGTVDGTPGDDALAAVLALAGLDVGRAGGLAELTPREREVLGLVVEGATNAQIAERLFISVDTVTRHLTHVYAKTGTRSRAQAVRYALERGLSGS